MANLALEDSDTETAAAEADDGDRHFRPMRWTPWPSTPPSNCLPTRSPDAWLEKIRQVNPTYGEGYALHRAFHLVFNRRYEDGVAYYRKAIDARSAALVGALELGINLMRLGQEDEPRQQLEMCYNNGYRDAATVNSLRLLDSYKNFVTFKDDTTILKLHKKRSRSAASLFRSRC